MSPYDRVAHILGQGSVALIGAQAAGLAPAGYLPVWLIIGAWVIAHVAGASTNSIIKKP